MNFKKLDQIYELKKKNKIYSSGPSYVKVG